MKIRHEHSLSSDALESVQRLNHEVAVLNHQLDAFRSTYREVALYALVVAVLVLIVPYFIRED